MNNLYKQYQVNSILTASPAQLTLMLYNGCIRFSNQAIEALEKADYNKANHFNLRVQDIIVELQATLDDKYEISKQLNDLYEIIRELLVEANIKKDKVLLEEVRLLLIEIKDLWQEVMKRTA